MPYKDQEKARRHARERGRVWRLKHPENARAARLRHYQKHREQQCANARAWYHANKEKALARTRRYQLRKHYGLTPEQFAALGTVCQICGTGEDSRMQKTTGKTFRLAVDHDHGTGKVRGLLCGNCNVGIGHFKHDVVLMQAGIDYLRRTA